MRIETARLILRPFEEKDLEDLYALLSDGEVVKYEPYLPMDREAVRQELLQRIGSDEFLAMELKENGRVIGNVYLGKRPFDSAELGYLLARAHWKQGYAGEACRAAVAYLFGQGVHRIYAECDPENTASWRLLERLAFEREAHLKQNVFFWRDREGNPIWKDTFIYGKLNG